MELLAAGVDAYVDHRRGELASTFGVDLDAMTGPELGNFMMETYFALVVELCELAGETGWKPWVADDARGRVNRERAVREAADLEIFRGNLYAALGIQGEELAEAVAEKTLENRERKRAGYRGRT
jgi:hypothetical protein